ncbi:unnamed protein product, partial [Discosporangium mesarthrocarpum]
FNAFGPVRLTHGKVDQWYKRFHPVNGPTEGRGWGEVQVPGWKAGLACCASDTISFHYVGPAEAVVMHDMLHDRER